jgi:hypothetical protein
MAGKMGYVRIIQPCRLVVVKAFLASLLPECSVISRMMRLASSMRPSVLLAALLASTVCAQNLDLPTPQKTGGLPLMDALAKRSSARVFAAKELSPQQLSSLLWACYGINRPDGKRTAPSAKNNQETDLYVILKQGAYVYDAKANKLELAASGDLRALAGTQDFATNAPVTLVFVADQAKME